MKKTALLLISLILALLLASCGNYTPQTVIGEDGREHSEFYIDGFDAEKMECFFDEVVLGSEYSKGNGDTSLVQKWCGTLTYSADGGYTQSDLDIIAEFFAIFKDSPGFPKVEYRKNDPNAALQLHFLPQNEFHEEISDTTSSFLADGVATYYFDANTNEIDSGVIYYNNDMLPSIRRAVLLEELYNVMGAANDTALRNDSIVYQFSTVTEDLSKMDELIMRLLYLPNIKCGMAKDEVNTVIAELYY